MRWSATWLLLNAWLTHPHAVAAGCGASSNRPALIVMDMQPVYIKRRSTESRPANVKKLDALISHQTEMIRAAIKSRIPILFIEYVNDPRDNNPDRATLDQLKVLTTGYPLSRVIRKTTDGLFDPKNSFLPDLQAFLNSKNIGTLIVVGANGGACVRESITQALDTTCSIVADTAGIADFNYDDFIYPYPHLPQQKGPCADCRYRLTDSASEILDVMKRGKTWGEIIDISKGGGGSAR